MSVSVSPMGWYSMDVLVPRIPEGREAWIDLIREAVQPVEKTWCDLEAVSTEAVQPVEKVCRWENVGDSWIACGSRLWSELSAARMVYCPHCTGRIEKI